ncbi:hypothetical protein KIL84_012677, partial [Mauremys mutica]
MLFTQWGFYLHPCSGILVYRKVVSERTVEISRIANGHANFNCFTKYSTNLHSPYMDASICMFDRNKPTDEASASSAQGIERRGIEGSLQQESSSSVSIRGPEQAGPGLSSVQNRQGYCNCCHVHYSNLEQ